MTLDRSTTAWFWGGAVVLIALAYHGGLDLPGRGAREALLPASAVALLSVALIRSPRRPNPWLLAMLGTAAVSCLLGILLGAAPDRLMIARDAMVLGAPWIACLAAAMLPDRDGPGGVDGAIAGAAALSLILLSGIGLIQAWSGWQGIAQVAPPAALFVNRNVAAQAVTLLLPLAAVDLLRPSRAPRAWLAVAAQALGLSFLIATRARGGWLALACGALVAVFVLVRSQGLRELRPALTRMGLAVGLAALAALVPVRNTVGTMPAVGSTLATLADPIAGSGGVRLALWDNTLAMTGSAALVGQGAGRFPVVYPLYQSARRPTPDFGTAYQPSHPHNDWLEYAAELGWPAALALAAALCGGLLLAGRRRVGVDPGELMQTAARAAVLGAALPYSLLSFPLHAPATAFVAWIVVGRTWAGHAVETSSSARARLIPAALALGLSAVLLWLGVGELRTRTALGQAVHALGAGDCQAALSPAEEAAGTNRLRDVRGNAAMIGYRCDPDQERALDRLEQALVVHPNNLNLLLAVGARRMNAGRLDGAQAAYRAATLVVPKQARPWTGLAMAQARSGDRPAATESCREALRLEPGLEVALSFCEANELVREAP